MNELKRLRKPGLMASAILHAVGLLFFWLAIITSPNVNARVPVNIPYAMADDGGQDIPPWFEELQQQESKPSRLQGAMLWMGASCWFFSILALSPTLLLSFHPSFRKREDIVAHEIPRISSHEPFVIHHDRQKQIHHRLIESFDDLEASLRCQPIAAGGGFFHRAYRENVNQLDSQTKMMYSSITNTHDNVQKTVARVQRLFRQCRESANFAATNRLDWKRNTMLGNLSQVRQSHDKVLDTSKNIAAIHASTLRLLKESIQGEDIFFDKISRVEGYLDQVQNSSNVGYKAHDKVVLVIGEAIEAIANATKLVNGLAQRSESLMAVTKQIDDISEKINLQAVNAALTLSRSKGRTPFDFGGIASELRSLTSRFHAQSRSLQEMSESLHGEIDQALNQLSESGLKAEGAFASVNQCGEIYRNTVSSTKYGLSELSLISKEVGIHMKKLGETRDLGESAGQLMGDLDHQLSGYNEMNKRISEETNQMAAHCDKLSHLLSKQYYELSHCEKMLVDSAGLLTEATQYATENKQNVTSIKTSLEEIVRQDPNKTTDDALWVAKLRAFRHLLDSLEEDFDSSPRSVDNRTALVPVMHVGHG